MGHFNRISMQISTMTMVYPSILAAYIGQGASAQVKLLSVKSHSMITVLLWASRIMRGNFPRYMCNDKLLYTVIIIYPDV